MKRKKEMEPHLLRRNRQRIRKTPLKSTISEGFWSEWRGSNSRPRGPKPRVLSAELHPDIQFLPLYHDGEENQRYFCLWSFLWSKPLLCHFQQPGEIQQTQVLQGFAAFCHDLTRIPPRHSQSRRATNCATPRYEVRRSGRAYSPKPGAVPTPLYPDIQFEPLYHGGGKNQRTFLPVVIMRSDPLSRRFRQPKQIP